jgi:uncharacterized membrane protein
MEMDGLNLVLKKWVSLIAIDPVLAWKAVMGCEYDCARVRVSERAHYAHMNTGEGAPMSLDPVWEDCLSVCVSQRRSLRQRRKLLGLSRLKKDASWCWSGGLEDV